MPKKKKPTDFWVRQQLIADPEPPGEFSSWIRTADDHEPLMRVGASQPNAGDNARRFVACWNACLDAGLTTEELEQGLVKQAVDLLKETKPDGR